MEKSLKRINSHEISGNLHSQFFDIRGIIARDFDGEKAVARKHLNDALVYASRTKNPLAIKRISAHLATLEKKERNFVKAIELYKQALAIASPPNDSGPTLECYEALGEIASMKKRMLIQHTIGTLNNSNLLKALRYFPARSALIEALRIAFS